MSDVLTDSTLEISSATGLGELNVDLNHPLARPFQLSLTTGKPMGRWASLLVEDERGAAPRVAGTFVYTAGDRLLFFPGAPMTIEDDPALPRFSGKSLEHLTLDPPRKPGKHSSHVAVQPTSDSGRGITYTTTPPPDLLIPWFTMLVNDMEGFYRLPSRLSISFPYPRADLQRFGEALVKERIAGIGFFPLPPTASSPNFVQFDVWAGRAEGWQEKRTKPLSWVYKPEIVSNPPRSEQTITANQVQIELSTSIGVVVIVSRPAGSLLGARILRPTLTS